MRQRFARGESASLADYLDRLSPLDLEKDRFVSLAYEEYCLREEQALAAGEGPPNPDHFCDRYPLWADSLRSQLRYHRVLSRVLEPSPRRARFPEVGDAVFDCELRRMLGSGGAARVFQAVESGVGDRLVALKFSADDGAESHIQGKLEHPHIVPILWARPMDAETGLRALCMPFRDGITLDRLLERFRREPSRPRRTARDFCQLYRDARGSVESALPGVPEDWTGFPIEGSFALAVAWLGQKLAEALAHAHHRQTVHRDLKPANILLAVTGGPMLLDFNLAHHPHTPERAENAMRGGTLPYMAPEQIAAFLDDRLWERVGPRSDLFALGLLLRELLTGQAPQGPSPELSRPRAVNEMFDLRSVPLTGLREIDRTIPRELERIIDRCTQFRAEDRYQDADGLARDFARFLDRASAKASSRGARALARSLAWPISISLLIGVAGYVSWNERSRSPSPEISPDRTSRDAKVSAQKPASRTSPSDDGYPDPVEDEQPDSLNVWAQAFKATGQLKFDESGINRTPKQMLTSIQRAVQTAANTHTDSQFLQALHCVVSSMSGTPRDIPAGISVKEIGTSELLREKEVEISPDLGMQLARFAHGQLKEKFDELNKESRRRLDTAALATLLALSVAPDSPSAQLEWGVCELYRRNRKEALERFLQCIAMLDKPGADDPVIRSACHYRMSVCFQEGIERRINDVGDDPILLTRAVSELGCYALQHADRALALLRDWPNDAAERGDSQFNSAVESYWKSRKTIQDLCVDYSHRNDQPAKALRLRIDDVVKNMSWMADIPGFQTDPSARPLDELRDEIRRCQRLVDDPETDDFKRTDLRVLLDEARGVVDTYEKSSPTREDRP